MGSAENVHPFYGRFERENVMRFLVCLIGVLCLLSVVVWFAMTASKAANPPDRWHKVLHDGKQYLVKNLGPGSAHITATTPEGHKIRFYGTFVVEQMEN